MSTITVEVKDSRKRDFLLALLAEFSFVRVVVKEATDEEVGPPIVEEPAGPPWSGHELQLKSAKTFAEVVHEQGNKELRFDELAGSLEDEAAEVSLNELLEAAK